MAKKSIRLAHSGVCLALSHASIASQSIGMVRASSNLRYADAELGYAIEQCKGASRENAHDGTACAIDMRATDVSALGIETHTWNNLADEVEKIGISAVMENVGIDIANVKSDIPRIARLIESVPKDDTATFRALTGISHIKASLADTEDALIAIDLFTEMVDAIKKGHRVVRGVKIHLRGAPMSDIATRKIGVA